MKDDRSPAVWLQCLQAAASIMSRQYAPTANFADRSQIAEGIAALADDIYQQYDNRFGLEYAKDGSGRVVRKRGT